MNPYVDTSDRPRSTLLDRNESLYTAELKRINREDERSLGSRVFTEFRKARDEKQGE